jgi:peptidyl-prolyl cis-trans isomerase SDCCAG10
MAEAEIAEGSEERPLYPTKITGMEIIINPFEDMAKRVRVAERTAPEPKKAKKPKRKAGKALLSFAGDDGEDAGAAPVAKKPKFNTALVSAGEERPSDLKAPMPTAAQDTAIPIRAPARTSPTRSPSPKPVSRSPSRETVPSPTPPPREPSPPQSRLDRVNAQIAAVKASMKRNTATQNAEPTKKKSLLESMVPASTIKGRKRGAAGNTASEKATLEMLTKFRSKLESAAPPPPSKTAKSPEAATLPEAKPEPAASTATNNAMEPEAQACDLHFIVGCQSCTAWDKQDEDESDDDTGWMSHALSFAKDRLGKDLEWKRKNEQELVVIDPREKALELGVGKRGKDKGKAGGREWDGPAKGKTVGNR